MYKFNFSVQFLFAAIDCGQLKSPTNGSLHGERTVFPESLRFSCDIGFVMGGSPVRQCQPNGTWSGTETTCSGKNYFSTS